jgi:hypothetical protein
MGDAPGVIGKIVFHGLPDLLHKIGHRKILPTLNVNRAPGFLKGMVHQGQNLTTGDTEKNRRSQRIQ